jgi:uncharacterized membrane protein YcaP (DUF421 family)
MEFLNQWWGINENITPFEIAARSAVMFLVALILIRVSGMRPFGKGDGVDTIISFLIGAILSRGVVGATPFFSTIVSAIVILFIHNLMTKLSLYNAWLERSVKGKTYLLYKNGSFIKGNMEKADVSEKDIYEELRLQCQLGELDQIKEVYMERTGEISFVKKETAPSR